MVIKAQYKNNVLTLETTVIQHSDVTFEITSDKLFTGFLVVNYKNKNQRTIELIKTNVDYVYRGRYKIYQEDVQNLVGAHTLTLCTNEGLTNVLSNNVNITFDIASIKQLITLDSNKEIIKLKKDIADLKQMVYNISSNKVFTDIKVTNLPLAEIGSIPVLINNAGVYMLKSPFANIIEQVNGVYPDQGAVEITADDISVANVTLTEFLVRTSNALAALREYNDTLKTEVINLTNKYNELELELQKHLSNPII